MIILVNSKISQNNIVESLGKPEYSYYFLLREFLPALEQIGTLIQINSLDDVDNLYNQYQAAGEDVVFLSVSPPHQTPVGLRCPTLCLFAWEFYNIPNQAWDNEPRNDWRYVFENIAGVIACSEESAQAVRNAMGEDYPVIALPAPVFDRFQHLNQAQGWLPHQPNRSFEFKGFLYDSLTLGLSADGLVQHMERPQPNALFTPPPPMARKSTWQITKEHWQAWRRAVNKSQHTTAQASQEEPPPATPNNHYHIELTGTVYTTVVNPMDNRKNWRFILTSFCWAFRDEPNVTLIVKATHHNLETYRIELLTVLSRLAPFSCRIILVHGFLEKEQYDNLIKITDFYINASMCEGLCLPLMEFLSSGKPVIAPNNTAMLDYINPDFSLMIDSTPEPCQWAPDPYGYFSTHRYRINWRTVMQHFQSSHYIAEQQPERYQQMSLAATARMQRFCNLQHITEKLGAFLTLTMSAVQQHQNQAQALAADKASL